MDHYTRTLQAVTQMIDEGAVAANGRLPTERALSETLGVGRRVLRRALDTLEGKGRITRRQGRGTFLAPTPATSGGAAPPYDHLGLSEIGNPVELIELRIALEPIMCRLAALRSSRRDVEHLQRLADRTGKARDVPTYQEADSAFHRLIAELSRNALFVRLQEAVGTALRDTALKRFGENGHCFKRQAEHVAYHRAIARAVAERDTDRAEKLMHEHLSDVHCNLFNDVIPAGTMARRQAGK